MVGTQKFLVYFLRELPLHCLFKGITKGYSALFFLVYLWMKIFVVLYLTNLQCCFLCREPGHQFTECPKRDEVKMGAGICFKCGSSEHTVMKCPRKNVAGSLFILERRCWK